MTDTPAHTPLPWAAQPLETGDDAGVSIIGSDLGGLVCASLPWPSEIDSGDYSRVESNAAFIVRACNSHYQLVEALRGIIDHFDCSHGNAPGHDHLIPGVWDKDVSNGAKGGTKCGWCDQWNEARAALSQAGGAGE